MFTLNALAKLMNDCPKAEVGIQIESLADGKIDVDELAKKTGRKYRRIASTRATNDSALELIEDYYVFSPGEEN